jgi:hypothetical protein
MGDLWAGQQLGVDDDPQVHLEYGTAATASTCASRTCCRCGRPSTVCLRCSESATSCNLQSAALFGAADDRSAHLSSSAQGGPLFTALAWLPGPRVPGLLRVHSTVPARALLACPGRSGFRGWVPLVVSRSWSAPYWGARTTPPRSCLLNPGRRRPTGS